MPLNITAAPLGPGGVALNADKEVNIPSLTIDGVVRRSAAIGVSGVEISLTADAACYVKLAEADDTPSADNGFLIPANATVWRYTDNTNLKVQVVAA